MYLSKRCLQPAVGSKRVVITGMGVLTSIGVNLQEAWKRVLNGECGIVSLDGEEYEKLPCKVAGKISEVNKILAEKFTSSELRTMAPSTAMALIAAEEALEDSGWLPKTDKDRTNTGVAIGVGMVDLNDICQTSEDLKIKGYKKVSPYFVPRILPNMAAGQISIKYGLRGPNHAVSTACATGAHSIGDAYRFIKFGDAKVMLCGGAESCICPLSIAGFSRLRALATNFNDEPKAASRPFDKKRNGFVMGEGSAILVMEELIHALSRNAKIYAEVVGYGLSGDGAHLTAPSEDGSGAKLSMKRALANGNLSPEDVGYINAHATSTPLGDAIESKAIKEVFGKHANNVRVSSTKGSHGHLLGAAGNLESVFTIMSIHSGQLPPSINLETVEEDVKLNFVANNAEEWTLPSKDGRRIALKNAFGFGGTNASLCFAQYKQ
ncbi:hypothetical protein RUM44_008811 [Polyplax serrata]|uniref:3-oxoacyl-[acyl-carrier-protein] synthase n=1 Tax=Polyplax serrata TaxID=468196 RepID=A0ABR1B9L6_POLSC